MKIPCFLLLALLALLAPLASAGTAELNRSMGLWDFNGNLNGRYYCFAPVRISSNLTIGTTSPGPYWTNNEYLDLSSDASAGAGLQSNEWMYIQTGAAANGQPGASFTNNWTIIMDVRWPATVTSWSALVNDAVSTDAEIFKNTSGALQFWGADNNPVVSNPLVVNTWYRLAFSGEYSATAGKQVLRAYINGTPTAQTSGGTVQVNADGRYGFNAIPHLFTDDNGETSRIQINSVAFWGETLSAADIAAIGTYNVAGIHWTGESQSAVCTPSGNLYFGSFLTTYNPSNAGNIAATVTSTTYPNAVADIELAIPFNTGVIPGKSQHKFGGTIDGHLMPNGDVIMFGTGVPVNYTGGGNDMETTANVTYRRDTITLMPDGPHARWINIYLPAGFGMAESDISRLLKTVVTQYAAAGVGGGVLLGAGLIPSGTISLSRADFGMPTGGTYPTGMWAVLDRMPVRWPTNAIVWNAPAGTFTHSTTGTLIYHHETEVNFNVQLQANSAYQEGLLRPSNDQYLLFARNGIGSNVVAARPGGAAAVQNAVASIEVEKFSPTLDATMITHYPLTVMIMDQGTPGRIAYVNDALDLTSSRLRNVTSNLLYSARTRPSTGCTGVMDTPDITPEALVYTTPSNEWFFTPDGGVHAPITFTTPETLDWGGWKEGAATYFAHSITTPFTTGRALIAGHAFRGIEAAAYQPQQRAAAMLLTGHSAPGNESLVERPLTDAYADGVADYAGVNVRVSGTVNAVSRLAGVATPAYPLRNTSKYYLRADGVSGRHDSSGSAFSFNAFGADFSISALRLAFLDGLNTASGVNGALTMPAPAQFGLNFRELLFGARGQLLAATVSPAQGDITLGFWSLKFTPLSLDFPQPKVCPDPAPANGFVRVGAQATLSGMVRDTTVTGALGFASGNLVVESDSVAAGLGPISRFEPGVLLSVPGPGTSNWLVNPTSGIYLNKANVDGNSTGTLSAAGRMNLPFFEDMPVHLSMSSNNISGNTPQIFTRRPWENFSSAVYDPGHLGHPPGVLPATYQSTSTSTWNPTATRDWQDLITFNFPVNLNSSTRWFESLQKTEQDVFLFHLRQGVKKMTPDNAELLFDGQASLSAALPSQVNVSTLLGDPNFLSLTGPLKTGIDGALASVGGLDALLTDNLAPLLKPGLQQVAADAISGSYYNQLAAAPDRSAKLNEIVPGMATQASGLLGGGQGGIWRADLLAKITAARSGMQSAKNLVQNATSLAQLAAAIGAATGNGGSAATPDPERLAAIQQFLDQIIARLTALETALGASGDLTVALNSALLANGGTTPWVQQAVNDVKAVWAPSNDAAALAYYTGYPPSALSDAIASALAERVAGSLFAGTTMQLLRQHLGDSQTMARQGVDDTLHFAENLIAPITVNDVVTSALGDLNQYTAAARINGYARINGDSLAELRLDGQVRLKVPDEMKFDGWFLIRSLDSTTPNAACLAAGGAKTEVGAGASAEFNWGTPNMILLGGKVALDGTGSPVGLCGDFALSKDIDFQAVRLSNLKFGFGFGANNGYLYARGAGKMQTMDVAAGVFIGQTCDLGVMSNADPDIGGLIPQILPTATLPVVGAMVYAEGGMSLMPFIGIPPSCALDVRVSGGQGFFGFADSGSGNAGIQVTAGIKQKLGVSGELLCIVDVNGELVSVIAAQGTVKDGGLQFNQLTGTARATVRGEVGVSPFSWDFEKSLGLKISANPSVSYSLDF